MISTMCRSRCSRGVWTVPNDFRLYLANLRNGISGVGDTTIADVYNADDVYDSTGSPMSGTAEITVTMPFDRDWET